MRLPAPVVLRKLLYSQWLTATDEKRPGPGKLSAKGREALMKSYEVCECGAPLRLREQATPQPSGTEVLLEVTAAGICHSDIHFWECV
jgi:hypothetical protein